ncbi:hypothetical protein [Bradyrhizobium sp. SSUT77]|uniref:hypothetical protein n=1 Tax=Bradyrhizobium sp. SSUT77 TaxID=3040603 RepID=UPI002448A074|nr:hypothetical protein [Bradyrhizobium sp. SSUT77]MDH2344388.1 hypothetical protein [Bradyrhizobium sp. SSUT77]
MKPGPFSAGVLGVLAVLAGPDRLPVGEQPAMVGKANADESRKDGGKESGKESRMAGPSPSVPMARDPSATVAREYELARRQGTREAFELFIARHGDDPLAEKARAELKQLPR